MSKQPTTFTPAGQPLLANHPRANLPAQPAPITREQLLAEQPVTAQPPTREVTSASPARFWGHSSPAQASSGLEQNTKPTGITLELVTKERFVPKGTTAFPQGAPSSTKR